MSDQRAWLDSAASWVRSRIMADGSAEDDSLAVDTRPTSSTAENSPAHIEPLHCGEMIGGLRLERLLTPGGSGAQVFVASEPKSGQGFAVKVFALSAVKSTGLGPTDHEIEAARSRFLRESSIAASLKHRDIVRVLNAGEERGHGYLVMDLLEGSNLIRYTRPDRLLPEPVALGIVARVASALAYAHAHGVIHRDIKPANVMVDLPRDRVTITDFGIASLAHTEHQRGDAVVGTPATMAPEQLLDAPVDGRADLYAVGVLLFQLLTGRLPFEGETIKDLAHAVVHDRPLRIADCRPELPSELSNLVAGLLEKAPRRRPGDGDMVARALLALSRRLQKSA